MYAHNRPTFWADPSGHCPGCPPDPLANLSPEDQQRVRRAQQEAIQILAQETVKTAKSVAKRIWNRMVATGAAIEQGERLRAATQRGDAKAVEGTVAETAEDARRQVQATKEWAVQAKRAAEHPVDAVREAAADAEFLGPDKTREIILDSTETTGEIVAAVEGMRAPVGAVASRVRNRLASGRTFAVGEPLPNGGFAGEGPGAAPDLPGALDAPKGTSTTRWGGEHGRGNVRHNNAIETELDWANEQGATSIRKNRVQRDATGARVRADDGSFTRPDASYVLEEKRHNTNYVSQPESTAELNRELDAFKKMVEADPKAQTSLRIRY
jgi:hypothetical protein